MELTEADKATLIEWVKLGKTPEFKKLAHTNEFIDAILRMSEQYGKQCFYNYIDDALRSQGIEVKPQVNPKYGWIRDKPLLMEVKPCQ